MENIYIKVIKYEAEWFHTKEDVFKFTFSNIPKDGYELLKTINREYTRTFAVGYSDKEIARLTNLSKVSVTLDMVSGVFNQEGEKQTQGAYTGYFIKDIFFNGYKSANGYGTYDEETNRIGLLADSELT